MAYGYIVVDMNITDMEQYKLYMAEAPGGGRGRGAGGGGCGGGKEKSEGGRGDGRPACRQGTRR